jgi:hypothetical protein
MEYLVPLSAVMAAILVACSDARNEWERPP